MQKEVLRLVINNMSFVSLFRKKNNKVLFTTPSHSQRFCICHKFRYWYRCDISETEAHNPELVLVNAEKRASSIYGTKYTKFLTNGSTSGIIAAVLSCVKSGENVLLWRNSHISHLNAVTLAGAKPVFYDLPQIQDWGIVGATSANLLEVFLKKINIKAVIITSPSYEGIVSDIEKIKKICEKYNSYLIVDEAHGALYPFSKRLPQSAVNIADFCIQSLHKTAGGINSTALLHSNSIDPTGALMMISTTSPSYPMLATIEANINYLNSAKGKNKIEKLIDDIIAVRKNSNCEFFGDDITKINIKKTSMSGYDLSEKLFNNFNIEDERTNEKSIMLLCGIGTDRKKLKKLEKALKLL